MKKQMRKRLLSLVLSALMIMSALPLSALAAEEDVPEASTAQTEVPSAPTAQPEDAAAEPDAPAAEPEEPAAEPQAAPEEDAPAVQDAAASGTLEFSTNLSQRYEFTYSQWGSPQAIKVAVGTYTPAGGTATALPSGTTIKYQWYISSDGTVGESDTKTGGNQTYLTVSVNKGTGISYYYVVATAEIDGVTYTGTSRVACVVIKVADVSVTLSVNDKGVLASDKAEEAVCVRTIKVADLDLDGKHSFDEAMVAAHKACLTEDAYAADDAGTMTKIWGQDAKNSRVYQNGTLVDGNVRDMFVKANDKLYISIDKDSTGHTDKFSTFDQTKATISTGVELDLVLTDDAGSPLPNIAVGYWEKGAFVPFEGKTTDEEGKVTLSFDKAGVYNVTAQGTVDGCALMAPGCAVTVKKLGVLKMKGAYSSNPYRVTVGETPYFISQVGAQYCIDDSWVSAVKVTTTYYRIKSDRAEPEVVTDRFAEFTEDDVGTWQYYMYAECDAYGVKLSVRSNFATVIVSKAGEIAGYSGNGFVSNLTVQSKYSKGSALDSVVFEEGKTDYAFTELDAAEEYLQFDSPKGKGLWWAIRINGVRPSSSDILTREKALDAKDEHVQVGLPKKFPAGSVNTVTLIVGTKYDSNEDGYITEYDEYDAYDVYNFTVTTAPALSKVSAKDSDNNTITLAPTQNSSNGYYITDSYGETNADTIKLTATRKTTSGVTLYVGDTAYNKNLSNEVITLADYRDAKGVANIPLKTVCKTADGTELSYTTTLHLSKILEAPEAPVITTQPTEELSREKDTTVKLSVAVEQPKDGSTLSYQWYDANTSYLDGSPIEGATAAECEVPASKVAGDRYIYCAVTATGTNGGKATTNSSKCKLTTKLTYVNKPVITLQPGIAADDKGGGVYRTSYSAGNAIDPAYFEIDGISASHSYVCEEGCLAPEFAFYYNTTPSEEGATKIEGTATGKSISGGRRYLVYNATTPMPEGDYYVFLVVTSRAADDETKFASTTSDFIKMHFDHADYGFEGSGSETDPFLLKTGDDFVKIQKFVNEQGAKFLGTYFKMANDITLPADWVPIGSNGPQGIFFGGTLDGDNHQLNFSKHSAPLFDYVSRATIRNLKVFGEEIQGCALVDKYWVDYNDGCHINNVTLVSGSSTLDCGFMSGAASSFNRSYITNCRVEEGVIIGYTKERYGLGSFAGGYVGTIENCTSAATIYGTSNIGGIAASKSNSMGMFSMKNCSFTGKIEATGSFIGGIAGNGYVSNSAPNATCVRVENCYVNADISGKSAVGGIFGGEEGVDQCWDNGIGYIRNNLFYGSLTATGFPTTENIGGSKGGIVGYMRSLNRYNQIENNYFYDKNGCEKAVGGAEHIDTSAKPFGLSKDDNIFYYDTSKDSLDDIKDFVDAEDKDTDDWRWTSVAKKDHNRTDDPMGKDAANLGKPCTTTEMADGTVLKKLNENENSMKNWEQGEEFPILSRKATVSSLTLSGSYKTEYYIGEKLDMTGAVFTAHWSDGTTTTPNLDDVTIEGFDSSARAVLTLKASYGGAEVEFQVRVIKKSSASAGTIKVSFTLLGDDKHGDPTEETGTHTLKSNNLKTWLEKKTYTVDENATVWDLMQKVEKETEGLKFSNPTGNYVDKLTYNNVTMGEFDNGTNSGWMYTLNGKHPLLGVSEQFLDNGDDIVWHYTDDYTVEEGSEPWNPSTGGGGGGGSTVNADDQKAANAVIDQIKAIGDVTKDSGDKITAARSAYDKLTEAQKKLVTNYGTLTDAERAYAGLTGKLPFTDVNGHWAYDAIKYAYENSLFAGTSATTFGPNVSMNRAMLVTVLYRLDKEPSAATTSSFKDVPADQWYTKAVAWASANKIVSGYSADTFGPTDTITREQMASILYRYAEYKGYDVSKTTDLAAFTDKASVSDWALTSMQWANAEKLINGRTATTLVPQGNATRAEVAQILMTFAETVAK